MPNNLIKVSNPSVAEQLKALGFSYIKEFVNKSDVYVFMATDDLLAYLKQNYNKCDFFMTDKLHF